MQEKKLKNSLKRAAQGEQTEGDVVKKEPKMTVKKTKVQQHEEVEAPALATSNGMKPIKKQKRKAEEADCSNAEEPKKHKKKDNKKSGENQVDAEPAQQLVNGIKRIDTSIFQHFTALTQQEENERLKAATQLIQQLHKTKESEKRQKELDYALKRLVRGCGAATNASRSGFFTGLVALLKTFKNTDLDITNIFDTIQKELHVGTTIANKEDADAVVGKILVCGALLRAGRISAFNSEHLEKVTNILLQATRHRTYHASLGYAFLIEMIETTLTQQQFEEAVWPLLLKELCKPWQKQTLQTVHCLIVVQRKFPSILNAKFLKTHFGGRELVNNESYVHLQRIFWSHSDTHIITHPAIEAFGVYLADCSNLLDFWTKTVDASIKTPTKLLEYLTLKIVTDVLSNLKGEKTLVAVDLLTPNFMKMLINGLKHIKLKKDETLKAFYDEFMEALVACCTKMPTTADPQKVAVIERLILYPGTFDIEKFTSTRIVHQLLNTLSAAGIQEIFDIYQQIFCGTLAKQTDDHSNEEWQHFERLNAGYMLQHLLAHKAVQQQAEAIEWRTQQLKFLMMCGLFHVQQTDVKNLTFEPCKKDAACSFSKDYGEQCKNMFYASLQSKLANLQQERQLLLELVEMCSKRLKKPNFKNLLRIKLSDKNSDLLHSAWKKMMNAVSGEAIKHNDEQFAKKSKKQKENNEGTVEDKLQLVFHILLLHMGLQLYREVEMAAPAIDDLLKCMQRTEQQQQKKQTIKHAKNIDPNEDDEPEWIEVVIDLFLHLLSQNAGAIRNSVSHLFPHLSGNLNVNAIHQILAVLDMKDGNNPLSRNGEDDETDEEDEEDGGRQVENGDNDEDSDSDEASVEEEAEDDDEDNEAEDDDDEDEEEEEDGNDEDEDVTANDKLRNAISQALIANGAAVNSVAGNKDADDDMASVDLNEMTEEEGKRLDEALAAAFKAMKNPKSGAAGSERKKSKSQRVETTTVMHFRIRVLDLIELYLQQPDTDLLNHIEIMLALYNMLQHCWSDDLKPLQAKVEKVLQKLTTIKVNSAANVTTSTDLEADDLVNYIRQIAEQKAPTLAFDLTNKIRNRCIVYLISCAARLPNGDAKVLDLCQQYQSEFLQSRNPTVNITLLSEIYKLRWSGIWSLASALANSGLKMETRAFRRIQVSEILAVLYRNHELQKQAANVTLKSFKKIEKALLAYIEALTIAWSRPQSRQSHKEFQTLLDLLLHAQRAHNRLQHTESTSLICAADTCEKVQELRRHIRLEATHMYHRYCGAFKLSVLRNSDVVISQKTDNSLEVTTHDNEDDDDADENQSKSIKSKANAKAAKKNKNLEVLKLKKQKKVERMLAASKGINGGFGVQQRATQEDDNSDSGSD